MKLCSSDNHYTTAPLTIATTPRRHNFLCKFPKDHCVWTLWTLNYVDSIPFSCIDSLHMAYNQAKQFKKILFSNYRKTWSNLHLCGWGTIRSVLFVCPSVYEAFFSGSTQRIFLIFCMRIFCHLYWKVTKPDFGKIVFDA